MTSIRQMLPKGTLRCALVAFALSGSLTSSATALAATPYIESWIKQPITSASTPTDVDASVCNFGAALAIAGKTALVAGPACPRENNTTGEVFVFEHDGVAWAELAPIAAPPGRQAFGYAVAATSDHFAVASMDLTSPQPLRMMTRAGPESAVDLPLPAGASAYHGYALALTNDTLAIADIGANDGAGSVAIYRLDDGTWSLTQTLPPEGGVLIPPGEYFGTSVVLNGDRLFVAASFQSGGGAVYAFERADSQSNFQQVVGAITTPSSSVAFGSSVAFELQTETLAIGDRDFNDYTGVVRLYRRELGAWVEQGVGLDGATDLGPADKQDSFGASIAFARGALIAGAPTRDEGDVKGVLLVFSPNGTGWNREGRFLLDDLVGSVAVGGPGGSVLACAGEPCNQVFGFTLAAGTSCTGQSACSSGICNDGVCCNEPCDGVCESCRGADTGGEDGTCLPMPYDAAPPGECEGADNPCGMTGRCDGQGACELESVGEACEAPSCDGNDVMPGGRCDGLGVCVPLEVIACSEGYECAEGACERTNLANPGKTAGEGGAPPLGTERECDRAAGFYLFEGACVVGAHCATQENAAYDAAGNETSCEAYTCTAGACRTSCSVGRRDCAGGFVCEVDSRECVPASSFAGLALDDASVTCAYSPSNSARPWLVLSIGCLALRRRKTQQISTAHPS